MKYTLKATLLFFLTITVCMATSQIAQASYPVCAGALLNSSNKEKLCPIACSSATTSKIQYRWSEEWINMWSAKDFHGNLCKGSEMSGLCGCVF